MLYEVITLHHHRRIDVVGRHLDDGFMLLGEFFPGALVEGHLGTDARRHSARDRATEIDRIEHHDRMLDDPVRRRVALGARILSGLEPDAFGDRTRDQDVSYNFV